VNSWKVIFATIVIFGAGVFTGGLLVNQVKHPFLRTVYAPQRTNQVDVLPAMITPEILKKQFVQSLNDKLDLTIQQSNQIQKIIAQGQENTRDLWKLVAPQFQVLWHDTRLQIRDVLTPEQRKQFEMLMKQHEHGLHRQQNTNAPAAQPDAPAATNGPAV
jgi:hypothetical protein